MTLFVDALKWFTDPAHYQGSDAVQVRVLEHLELSGLAVLVAALIALPIGLYLGHTGRFGRDGGAERWWRTGRRWDRE